MNAKSASFRVDKMDGDLLHELEEKLDVCILHFPFFVNCRLSFISSSLKVANSTVEFWNITPIN